MKVVWTDNARDQLQAIHDFIAQTSADYAKRTVDRITHRSKQIASFPLSGRIVPECQFPQVREVIEGSYRIIYHIAPDQINVIAIIHQAQQTPWKD